MDYVLEDRSFVLLFPCSTVSVLIDKCSVFILGSALPTDTLLVSKSEIGVEFGCKSNKQ